MSFIRVASKYNPMGLYQMDDTTPIQDYSPFNRNAVISGGTPTKYFALIKGATYAPIFTSAITAAFDSPVFVQGKEADSFSLWATVVPISHTAAQQVLSHSGQTDGLSINGTVVTFSTKYLTTGSASVSYDLQVPRAVNVVGIHTRTKNSLMVDGKMVAEVEITPAQQLDSYVATDGKLYAGATTGSSKIGLGAVGYFAYALTAEAVLDMHRAARDVPAVKDIIGQRGGDPIDMSRDISSVFVVQNWYDEQDWKSASLNNIAVVNGRLVPVFSGTTSQPGYWIDTFSLNSAGTTSIYGVNLDWDGNGAVVEASLDGAAWTTAVRGTNLSIIPNGFNPTGKQLLIRVSFPGGIIEDTSYIDNLTATGFKTAASAVQAGRQITLTSAYEQLTAPLLEFNDRWGTKIASGGTVVVGADTTNNPVADRVIELWIKPTTATNPTVSTTGTYYQNGVAATATLPTDQWTLFHIVSSTDIGSFTITGPALVGSIGLYPTLTAQNIADIANAYSGANPLLVGDNSVVALTQSTNAALVYAYNWSILSSG